MFMQARFSKSVLLVCSSPNNGLQHHDKIVYFLFARSQKNDYIDYCNGNNPYAHKHSAAGGPSLNPVSFFAVTPEPVRGASRRSHMERFELAVDMLTAMLMDTTDAKYADVREAVRKALPEMLDKIRKEVSK